VDTGNIIAGRPDGIEVELVRNQRAGLSALKPEAHAVTVAEMSLFNPFRLSEPPLTPVHYSSGLKTAHYSSGVSSCLRMITLHLQLQLSRPEIKSCSRNVLIR